MTYTRHTILSDESSLLRTCGYLVKFFVWKTCGVTTKYKVSRPEIGLRNSKMNYTPLVPDGARLYLEELTAAVNKYHPLG